MPTVKNARKTNYKLRLGNNYFTLILFVGVFALTGGAYMAYKASAAVTFNGISETGYVGKVITATGTCTPQGSWPSSEVGAQSNVSSIDISTNYLGLYYQPYYANSSSPGVLYQHAGVVTNCANGAGVATDLTGPATGTFAWDDTAGTLTVKVNVPNTYLGIYGNGDYNPVDPYYFDINLTAGSGSNTIVFKADTAAEKRALVSYHKKYSSAKSAAGQAAPLTDAIMLLQNQ